MKESLSKSIHPSTLKLWYGSINYNSCTFFPKRQYSEYENDLTFISLTKAVVIASNPSITSRCGFGLQSLLLDRDWSGICCELLIRMITQSTAGKNIHVLDVMIHCVRLVEEIVRVDLDDQNSTGSCSLAGGCLSDWIQLVMGCLLVTAWPLIYNLHTHA